MARTLAATRIDWVGVAFAVVLTIVIVFPLVVVGTWAFAEVWRFPALIPQQFGLKFWNQTLARADVWEALRTSLTLSVMVTFLSALICLPAANNTTREQPGD
jgi:putative spermidine/putrescine transport system permease protein